MTSSFWRIVMPVTIWHIAASLCFYGIYAGTSLFQNVYRLSGMEIGFIITSLTLGWVIFLLPIGALTDRVGERKTLTAGLVGISLGVFFVALSSTYWLLLAAVFLLGSVYGSGTPGTNKAIFRQIEPGRQHSALGIKQIGPTVGSAIGAVLVTGLAGIFFWQAGYLIAGLLGLAVAGGFWVVYPRTSQSKADLPDFRGLLANRTYLYLLPVGTCLGGTFYTTTGYVVPYIHESVGATVATGGLVLAVAQIANSTGRILAGGLADVLPGSARTRISGLLAVQALGGGVLFLLLPLTDTILTALVVFAGLGLFMLGSAGIYNSCISTVVETEKLGPLLRLGSLQ